MLLRGEEAFRETMANLLTLNPLPPLEIRKELTIELPANYKDWSNKDVIGELVTSKKKELADKYSNFSFHFDMGTNLPDVSAVLQLVDDNAGFNGIRRNNILSTTHKYVGVGYGKEKTNHCFYFLFAS